jgi:hypothetical protein
MFQTKVVEKIKTRFLWPEGGSLWDYAKKCGTARQRLQMITQRMRSARWITNATHTHTLSLWILNTLLFHGKMVTRKLIIVAFIYTLQVLFISIIYRSFLKILSVQFHSLSQVESLFLHPILQFVQPFSIPYIPARVVILSNRTVVNSTALFFFEIFTGLGCKPNAQPGRQRCPSLSRNSLLACPDYQSPLVPKLQPANSRHHCLTYAPKPWQDGDTIGRPTIL